MTDREREDIDSTAKRSIRELSAGIQALEQASMLLLTTEEATLQQRFNPRPRFAALATWA